MNDNLSAFPPKTGSTIAIRSQTRAPLTPVGTPERDRQTAETVHKTSSTGSTIDIMILPRSADEDKKGAQEGKEALVKSVPEEESPNQTEAAVSSTMSIDQPIQSVQSPKQVTENGLISAPIDAAKTEFEGMGMTGSELLANLPEGLAACPFLEHGCHKVGTDKEVKLHLRDDRLYHLVLLCRTVLALRITTVEVHNERELQLAEFDNSLHPAYCTSAKYSDQCIFQVKNINEEIHKMSKTKGCNVLYSQPFETHRFGYRMMAMVAPFGDGDAARKYISVYVSLVKGAYDPILRWPFKHPISFTAYSRGRTGDLTKRFVPNPTPENDCFFGQPKSRNAAIGFQCFCKQLDLDKYIINGDFFLGIHVDLSAMELERTRRVPSDDL